MTADDLRDDDQPASPAASGSGSPLAPWTLPDMSTIDPAVLEQLVTHLARVTPEGRRKAAQDPATRMYLQAGLRLLEEQVRSNGVDADSDDQSRLPHPFLAWLSRSRIADETRNETERSGLPRKGTAAGLRDRWEPHSDYIADLIQVALTGQTWGKAVTADNDRLWRALAQHEDFAQIIEEVAYLGVMALQTSAGFRIQLLAAAMAPRDPQIQASLQDLYAAIVRHRVDMFERIFEARGLVLRAGLDFELMSEFMSAFAEGLAVRLMVDPDAAVIDHGRRSSLLGLGALSLMLAGVDFNGDGLSLEEYLRRSFGSTAPTEAG